MNLKDFQTDYGIGAIVRRHFDYRSPFTAGNSALKPFNFPLVYSRSLDHGKLGLNCKGARAAIEQGQRLVELSTVPGAIICGCDQRNFDGANLTAEAIIERMPESSGLPVLTSPALTYPHYSYADQVKLAAEEFGDYMVHRNLAGEEAVEGLWTERPETFEARIVSGVMSDYPNLGTVLFDLNFEQLVLLYFLHVRGLKRVEIPFEKGAWVPTKGGGIVYSEDRTVVKEFHPDLTIVE